jgi:transposase
VRGKCPDQLRLPFMLWTRGPSARSSSASLASAWPLRPSARYLRRWGFSPQKPIRKAYEQNPTQIRYWLQTKYPAIRQQAKELGARIYWGDEMGLRSDHAVGRTWGVKGQMPVVKATGNRFGCNMISAITNQGHLSFMVFEGRFTSAVFIEFLRRLARQNEDQTTFLIVDRHRAHRSRKVEEWLAANPEAVRLFYLPGYSPDLNPDELLNQDIKSNSVGKRRAKDKAELLKNVQRKPSIVRRYFEAESVRYAA